MCAIFKKIIDEQHKDGKIPRIFSHVKVRETKFINLEERKKEEKSLTLCHEKATCKEHAHDVYQIESLDKAKTNLDDLGIV